MIMAKSHYFRDSSELIVDAIMIATWTSSAIGELKFSDESQLERSSTRRDNDLACHLWKTRCHATRK